MKNSIILLRIRLFLPKNRTSLLKIQMIPAAQTIAEGILEEALGEIPEDPAPTILEEAAEAGEEAAAEETAVSPARQVQPEEQVRREIRES